jgi:hypothetical protein
MSVQAYVCVCPMYSALLLSQSMNTKFTTANKDIRTNVTEPCGLLTSSALLTPKMKSPNHHDLKWMNY